MPRKIYEFQSITQDNLDNDALLGVIGDPVSGLLYKPTVAQLKILFGDLIVGTDDDSVQWIVTNVLNAPPGSPSPGESFRVGESPTGAWVGHAGQIATDDQAGGWTYESAINGDYLLQTTDSKTFIRSGSVWKPGKGIPILNGGNKINTGVRIGTANAQPMKFLINKQTIAEMFTVGADSGIVFPSLSAISTLQAYGALSKAAVGFKTANNATTSNLSADALTFLNTEDGLELQLLMNNYPTGLAEKHSDYGVSVFEDRSESTYRSEGLNRVVSFGTRGIFFPEFTQTELDNMEADIDDEDIMLQLLNRVVYNSTTKLFKKSNGTIWVDYLAAGALPYKSLVGFLSQASDASDVVVTELYNDLGDTIVFERNSAGFYSTAIGSALTVNKTIVMSGGKIPSNTAYIWYTLQGPGTTPAGRYTVYVDGSNQLTLLTKNNSNVSTDLFSISGAGNIIPIEIRVYY